MTAAQAQRRIVAAVRYGKAQGRPAWLWLQRRAAKRQVVRTVPRKETPMAQAPDLAKAADIADAITKRNMDNLTAMLSIYEDAEKAAWFEGMVAGAYFAGQLEGRASSAGLALTSAQAPLTG